jgi:hypothetical protein
VQVLLACSAVAAGVFAALGGRALQFDDWTTTAADRTLDAAIVAGAVAALCLVLSYVAVALWCGRLYRNLFALDVGGLRFTPRWGVGAWFVPFLNLVRPKQIVNDLWRASDPSFRPSCAWRGAPVAGMVHVWWALLLLSGFFAPLLDAEELYRDGLVRGLVGATCMVLLCGVGWFVTSELTDRIEVLAAGRGLWDVPIGRSPRLGTWAPILVCGLALVGFGAGAVATPSTALTASGFTLEPDASRRTSILDLEIGDCFGQQRSRTSTTAVSGEEVEVVDVVPCDVPHVYELIDLIVHDAPSGTAYPGIDALNLFAAGRCAEHFENIVGTPFLQSALDVQLLTPTEDGWRLGDREIDCAAFRMDGQLLGATVVGSGL